MIVSEQKLIITPSRASGQDRSLNQEAPYEAFVRKARAGGSSPVPMIC
ncbi:MAG: hypothetical protein ACXADA_09715 [Candidatus Hodarchaeales archaeon]